MGMFPDNGSCGRQGGPELKKVKLTPFKIVAIVIFILCLIAFNAGYGSDSKYVNFAFRVATLLMFVGLIWYLAGGAMKAFFKGRSEGIARELADLEKAKSDAEERLKAAEKQILGLEAEKKSILDSYKAQGEAIKADIIAKAESTAAQIVEQSRLAAHSELERAVQQIRDELSEEIIAATEKTLQASLSAEDHARLIDKSLTKVVLN